MIEFGNLSAIDEAWLSGQACHSLCAMRDGLGNGARQEDSPHRPAPQGGSNRGKICPTIAASPTVTHLM
jgi:hypothetical protein